MVVLGQPAPGSFSWFLRWLFFSGKRNDLSFLLSISQNFLRIPLNGLTALASFPTVAVRENPVQAGTEGERRTEEGRSLRLILAVRMGSRKSYCDHLPNPPPSSVCRHACTLRDPACTVRGLRSCCSPPSNVCRMSQQEELEVCLNGVTGHRLHLDHGLPDWLC